MIEKKSKQNTAPPKAEPLKKVAEAKKSPTVVGMTLKKYSEKTSNSHKGIVFSETAGGKTRFYMRMLEYLKKLGIKPEQVLMCILNTDRAIGVTSFINSVPVEYVERIMVYQVVDYDTLIDATNQADELLMKHIETTGTSEYAILIHELLGEPWTYSQDHYVRKSYDESLGDYFATKKGLEKAVRDDVSAYRALDGWKDWSVIKLLHNSAWMDKLKNKDYHVWFTAEVRPGEEGSIFEKTGRPAGEKLDIHRVNEILYLSREGEDYFMNPIKLTGYTKRYPKQKVTGINAYERHIEKLQWLESKDWKETIVKEIEREAEITPPEKPSEEESQTEVQEISEPEPEAEEPKEPQVVGEEPFELKGEKYIYYKVYDNGEKKKFQRTATDEDKAKLKKPTPAPVAKPKPQPKSEETIETNSEGGVNLDW